MSAPLPTKPAERRREKVRASILEAAESVFADEGVDGLSIRRIAEAIDYSPAAIYKYFSSKEELLDELKEAFFAQLIDNASLLEDENESFHDRARLCLETYVRTALNKSHHYAAAFSGVIDMPVEHNPEFFERKKGQAFMILLNMVDEGQALGIIRKDLPSTATAKSIWASCHGLASLMAHMSNFQTFGPDDLTMTTDEFISFHADQIMRGIEVRRTEPTKTKPSSRKRTM